MALEVCKRCKTPVEEKTLETVKNEEQYERWCQECVSGSQLHVQHSGPRLLNEVR